MTDGLVQTSRFVLRQNSGSDRIVLQPADNVIELVQATVPDGDRAAPLAVGNGRTQAESVREQPLQCFDIRILARGDLRRSRRFGFLFAWDL